MSLALPSSAVSATTAPGPKTPRTDDRLRIEPLKDVAFEISEDSFLLDLTGANLSAPFFSEILGVSDTRLAVESPNSRIYIEEAGDTLLYGGNENGKTSVLFSMPVIWYWDGIHTGDSIAGSYSGSGSYCNRLRLNQEGTFVTKMEAEGVVVLPDGDSLRHVQMVATTRRIATSSFPTDTLSDCDSDLIQHLSAMTEKTCRFYAPGYRYPIVELSELYKEGNDKPRNQSALFCSPFSQEELAYDEENEAIREALSRICHTPSGPEGSGQDEGRRPYCIVQDDAASRMTVTYDLPEASVVRALLCNSHGMVFQSVTEHHGAGSGYTLTLSYAGLHHGQYAVRLTFGSDVFMETFNLP